MTIAVAPCRVNAGSAGAIGYRFVANLLKLNGDVRMKIETAAAAGGRRIDRSASSDATVKEYNIAPFWGAPHRGAAVANTKRRFLRLGHIRLAN
jgi:hypothetical protein